MIICYGLPKVNSRLASILYISIVAVIGACQQSERPEAPATIQPVDNSQYFLYDSSCQQQSLQEIQLITTDDDAGLLRLKSDASSLQTNLIAKTIYGETYHRYCHLYDDHGGQRCLDSNLNIAPWVKVAGSGKELRLCPIDGNYPEDSFEYVAVASAYYLQRAQEFFARSIGDSLPQMNLLILPFFQTVYQQDGVLQDNFLYNNIMYFPAGRNLAVLPEPRNHQGASLWDSSFVLAHEFAHHVQFAQMHSTLTNLAALGHSPYRRGLEAFLEGWADVFAYYSEGESSHNVTHYPCLGDNRDVARAYFSDGRAKIVDRRTLANYTNPRHQLPSSCGETNFNSSHTIGAVFAHHIHTIVSHVLDNLVDYSGAVDKYRYLHGWLSRAVARRQKSDSLFADLLANVYGEVRITIDNLVDGERQLQLQNEVCQLFERGFPQISGCNDD